jgi:hypothetical protein
MELGVVVSELCNRDGCKGIIEEHEKEGGCSCHINPPCVYCTQQVAYCDSCGWEASEEVIIVSEKQKEINRKNAEYFQKQNEEWQKARKEFYDEFNGKSQPTKLKIRKESHTHFSMKVFGVFPNGTETASSLRPKVEGTFGGRFTLLDDTRFIYIAYTD